VVGGGLVATVIEHVLLESGGLIVGPDRPLRFVCHRGAFCFLAGWQFEYCGGRRSRAVKSWAAYLALAILPILGL
jgi:hypothetical protein